MLRSTLNLGVLAHVDAGKTTLSERLLHAAGAIDEIGSVDAGTTVTDSLALERRRGITIRSAVAALSIHGVSVNLVDTPGHPDFVAEVDRVLGVLDGAVLVVSAVEGVQPQTRVLMRALTRLQVPTVLFVNKIDRRGADVAGVLAQVERRLHLRVLSMVGVERAGSPRARVVAAGNDDAGFRASLVDALCARDEQLLARFVQDERCLTTPVLLAELAKHVGQVGQVGQVDQVGQTQVVPAYAGSAATGAGIEELMTGLVDLLPRGTGDADGPVSARIFKIERGRAGEKVAFARVFSGTVRIRDRLNDCGDKVTAVQRFERGSWSARDEVRAGEIGKLWGLTHARIGDAVGEPRALSVRQFDRPSLETVIEAVHPADEVALRTALAQLAEQDPLIEVRVDATHHELAVSLYGEVQKEVIVSTLADDYGIEVRARPTTPLYLERPTDVGEAIELLNTAPNPFRATIGLRVEPAPAGSGVTFALAVDFRSIPLFVYQTVDGFRQAMERYVRDGLREGLSGWAVSDCVVTLTESTYSSPDGPPSTFGELSTAADFRKLTPLVLMQALDRAGTTVCEPMSAISIEAPVGDLGPVLGALGSLQAEVGAPVVAGDDVTIDAALPSARLQDLHGLLPGLTSGEATVDARACGHRAVRGAPPSRRRTTVNPLHRQEYLASLRAV